MAAGKNINEVNQMGLSLLATLVLDGEQNLGELIPPKEGKK